MPLPILRCSSMNTGNDVGKLLIAPCPEIDTLQTGEGQAKGSRVNLIHDYRQDRSFVPVHRHLEFAVYMERLQRS